MDYCNRGAGCGGGLGHCDHHCVCLQTQSKVDVSALPETCVMTSHSNMVCLQHVAASAFSCRGPTIQPGFLEHPAGLWDLG